MQHSHSYKVKIINPSRKSDVIVRQLHDYYSRFESVVGIRAKLIERFKDQVPNSISFDVGYFEGQKCGFAQRRIYRQCILKIPKDK